MPMKPSNAPADNSGEVNAPAPATPAGKPGSAGAANAPKFGSPAWEAKYNPHSKLYTGK